MRKIIAALLAVLMLASVLAMLPASAEIYDGTEATTAGLHQLIITEISQYSHEKANLDPENPEDSYKNVSSTGFIEVFNNTGDTVEFDTLSLLRALNFVEEIKDDYDPMYPYNWTWSLEKKFMQKMDIKKGNIISDADRTEYYSTLFGDTTKDNTIFGQLSNSDADLDVANGKAAIIWFVNEASVNWMKNEFSGTFNARELFVKRFYGEQANAADYNIIMVWADSNWQLDDDTLINPDMFTWDIPAANDYDRSVVIALADNTWDLANDSCNGAVNSKIKSIVTIGNLVADYASATSNTSAVFASANTKPLLKNKKNAFIGNTTSYNDYVAAGLAMSYAEVGAVLWGTAQTPGKLTDWQYAMMADVLTAVTFPDTVNTPAKQTAVMDAFYIAEKLGDIEAGEDEEHQGHNYKDRADIDIFGGSNDDDEAGFNWIILVIIGGAVLVLAAVAVVVFVVILPKKKAAAAAADAEVEATEEAAEEAPAEEATEEAPAEEKIEE